ncbi:MAG: GNAT family N-acetyltransferase [Lachnospiraceae bacterium]|nr:GNAT family N-acetyltransferase [Lachnospiraceae bacterium]
MQLGIKSVKLSDRDIKRIYFDAFPKSERMPFLMMVAMSKLWNTQFLGFYDEDIPCGFVYFALNRNIIFVMFLAVDERVRSKGYGSAILMEIKNRYPDKKIIISIEPCDDNATDIDIRKRRKAFYMQNGYCETGYMIKLNGVVQEIIITNGKFDKKEFLLFFILYSNGTVWPKIWKRNRGSIC